MGGSHPHCRCSECVGMGRRFCQPIYDHRQSREKRNCFRHKMAGPANPTPRNDQLLRMPPGSTIQLNIDNAWRNITSFAISAVPPAGIVTTASRSNLCTAYSFMIP